MACVGFRHLGNKAIQDACGRCVIWTSCGGTPHARYVHIRVWFELPLLRRGLIALVNLHPGANHRLATLNVKTETLPATDENCESMPKIVAKQTGKSASLRIQIDPVSDFSDLLAAAPIVSNSLQQVRNLIRFYKTNETAFSQN
jgi:hypothetical protein